MHLKDQSAAVSFPACLSYAARMACSDWRNGMDKDHRPGRNRIPSHWRRIANCFSHHAENTFPAIAAVASCMPRWVDKCFFHKGKSVPFSFRVSGKQFPLCGSHLTPLLVNQHFRCGRGSFFGCAIASKRNGRERRAPRAAFKSPFTRNKEGWPVCRGGVSQGRSLLERLSVWRVRTSLMNNCRSFDYGAAK